MSRPLHRLRNKALRLDVHFSLFPLPEGWRIVLVDVADRLPLTLKLEAEHLNDVCDQAVRAMEAHRKAHPIKGRSA